MGLENRDKDFERSKRFPLDLCREPLLGCLSGKCPIFIEKSDFNVDELDFEADLYVVHQTHSGNADSILRK